MNTLTPKKVQASSSAIHVSERKAKIVCDAVKNISKNGLVKAQTAVSHLKFSRKATFAKELIKVINSAIANAEHNFSMDIDKLVIETIRLERALCLKRMITKGRGRAGSIKKRFCRVVVILSEIAS